MPVAYDCSRIKSASHQSAHASMIKQSCPESCNARSSFSHRWRRRPVPAGLLSGGAGRPGGRLRVRRRALRTATWGAPSSIDARTAKYMLLTMSRVISTISRFESDRGYEHWAGTVWPEHSADSAAAGSDLQSPLSVDLRTVYPTTVRPGGQQSPCKWAVPAQP